jgi:hypothetical protein
MAALQEEDVLVQVPVMLDATLKKQLEAFCSETGAGMDSCFDEAVRDWIDSVMPMHRKAFRRHQHASSA